MRQCLCSHITLEGHMTCFVFQPFVERVIYQTTIKVQARICSNVQLKHSGDDYRDRPSA